jgi:hypothetical protein
MIESKRGRTSLEATTRRNRPDKAAPVRGPTIGTGAHSFHLNRFPAERQE